jgi:hypothetical protein
MKTFSYILHGSTSTPISTDIGLIEPSITSGKWCIRLNTVGFEYLQRVTPKIVIISSNFVMSKQLNKKQELTVEPSPLAMSYMGGNSSAHKVIGFKSQEYLEVNSAQGRLEIYIKSANDGQFVQGANATILVHLKRVE